MKPLSEWTTDDLHVELTHPRASGNNQSDRRTAVLDELLRRKERETIERCAAAVRARWDQMDDNAASGPMRAFDREDGVMDGLSEAECIIRGMS